MASRRSTRRCFSSRVVRRLETTRTSMSLSGFRPPRTAEPKRYAPTTSGTETSRTRVVARSSCCLSRPSITGGCTAVVASSNAHERIRCVESHDRRLDHRRPVRPRLAAALRRRACGAGGAARAMAQGGDSSRRINRHPRNQCGADHRDIVAGVRDLKRHVRHSIHCTSTPTSTHHTGRASPTTSRNCVLDCPS